MAQAKQPDIHMDDDDDSEYDDIMGDLSYTPGQYENMASIYPKDKSDDSTTSSNSNNSKYEAMYEPERQKNYSREVRLRKAKASINPPPDQEERMARFNRALAGGLPPAKQAPQPFVEQRGRSGWSESKQEDNADDSDELPDFDPHVDPLLDKRPSVVGVNFGRIAEDLQYGDVYNIDKSPKIKLEATIDELEDVVREINEHIGQLKTHAKKQGFIHEFVKVGLMELFTKKYKYEEQVMQLKRKLKIKPSKNEWGKVKFGDAIKSVETVIKGYEKKIGKLKEEEFEKGKQYEIEKKKAEDFKRILLYEQDKKVEIIGLKGPKGDQMAPKSAQRRKPYYSSMANNRYYNRIDSSSTSTRIDDIADSIYDGVDDLLEYVYEQDELIEEQNRQIAQLEDQILNRRRRRQYNRRRYYG